MITPLARLGAAIVLALSATLATACTAAPALRTRGDRDDREHAERSRARAVGRAHRGGRGRRGPDLRDASSPTTSSPTSRASGGRPGPIRSTSANSRSPKASSACGRTSRVRPATTCRSSAGRRSTDDAAEDAQANLVSQGWVREDGADGVYITESPEMTIAPDEQGYGMTYLFGDGWVIVADTKQGLVLIEWPRRLIVRLALLEREAVLPGALRRVHRGIGPDQQLFPGRQRAAVRTEQRDAHAHRSEYPFAGHLDGFSHQVPGSARRSTPRRRCRHPRRWRRTRRRRCGPPRPRFAHPLASRAASSRSTASPAA